MKTTNLYPLHDNLILDPSTKKGMSGKIIIPEAHQGPPNASGIVIDKGPLCDKNMIQIGDKVFFPMHSENRVEITEGKIVIFVSESNILGTARQEESPSTKVKETEFDKLCHEVGFETNKD